MSKYIKSSGHYTATGTDESLSASGHCGKPVLGGEYITASGQSINEPTLYNTFWDWMEIGGTISVCGRDITLTRSTGAGPLNREALTLRTTDWPDGADKIRTTNGTSTRTISIRGITMTEGIRWVLACDVGSLGFNTKTGVWAMGTAKGTYWTFKPRKHQD